MPLHLLGISRSADVASWDTVPTCHASPQIGNLPHVQWIAEGDLSAAASSSPPPAIGPLEHAALLAVIHRHGDVLPMRFGVALSDAEAVRDLLRRRQPDLVRDLDRLHGTAELGVRIELDHRRSQGAPPETIAASQVESSPAEYLAARRAQYQRQDELAHRAQHAAETCTRLAKGLYRDWRRLCPEPPGVIRLAFLVERKLSAALADRLESLRSEEIGHGYTVLGPWPPYSFA